MRPSLIYLILLATGFAIGIVMVLIGIVGIGVLLTSAKGDPETALLMAFILLGMAGYIGLGLAFFSPQRPGRNVVWLVLGFIGWTGFAVEGGAHMWQWIIQFEEPMEWFFICWPPLVALVALAVNLVRLKLRGRNESSLE